MTRAGLVLLVALAGCSSSSAGAAPKDAAASCAPEDAGCQRCDDGKWHCAGLVFPDCPGDALDGGACTGDAGPCISCTPAAGQQFECSGGAWAFVSGNVACTP